MPCKNNAECENIEDNFICHCSMGFYGHLCSDQLPFSDFGTARFNRNSFLSFQNSLLPRAEQSVSFMLKTKEKDGLLFYFGQTEDSKGKDFLMIVLTDGLISMQYELGSGKGLVETTLLVNDDKPHKIWAKLVEKDGFMQVDDTEFNGTSPGVLKVLNTDSHIYIGGKPDFDLGFVGCVWDIQIGKTAVTNISLSRHTRNILPCDML